MPSDWINKFITLIKYTENQKNIMTISETAL